MSWMDEIYTTYYYPDLMRDCNKAIKLAEYMLSQNLSFLPEVILDGSFQKTWNLPNRIPIEDSKELFTLLRERYNVEPGYISIHFSFKGIQNEQTVHYFSLHINRDTIRISFDLEWHKEKSILDDLNTILQTDLQYYPPK